MDLGFRVKIIAIPMLFLFCSNFNLTAQNLTNKSHEKLLSLAELNLDQNPIKSHSYLDSIIFEFNEPLDSSTLLIMKRKVQLLMDLDSLPKSLANLQELLTKAENSNDTNSQAWLHSILAELYLNHSEFDSSITHIRKAFKLYSIQGKADLLGQLLLKKGTVEYAQGKYIESIESVFEATKWFEKSNQEKQLAFSYLQIGTTYLYIDYFDQASDYYQLAAKAFLRVGDSLGNSICLANLGLVQLEKENYSEALNIFKEAHDNILKSKKLLSISTSFRYMGFCFQGLNQIDSAIHYFNLALNTDLKLKYPIGICSDYLSLSEVYFELNRLDSAFQYADSALYYYQKDSDIELEADLSLLLAKILSAQNKHSESNQYFKNYISLQDSIKGEQEKVRKIAEQENRKLEHVRKELLLSRQESMIQAEENRIQQYFLIILSIIAVVSLFFLGLIAATNRKNRQLNQALNDRNFQIEKDLKIKQGLLKEVHHRVKNSLQVISSTLNIQIDLSKSKELKKALTETRSRINSLSIIHESLYRDNENDKKTFSHLVKKMIAVLANDYKVGEAINYKLQLEDFHLSLDDSIPAGVFLCEVISNVFKHAYDGKGGDLFVKLYKKENRIHLLVEDYGIGLPNKTDPYSDKSLGFLLINAVTKQLEGELKIDEEKGLSYHLSWEAKEDKLLA